MRALVFGATGFIGYWLSRALRAQGAHVTCVVRTAAAAERLTSEQLGDVVVRRDLSSLDHLDDWLPALRPSVVFNLAGYGVDRTERDDALADIINHQFVDRLAQVVAAMPRDEWDGVRLVHVGSALEYGTTGGILSEESPCAPPTVYGLTKLAGTRAVQRAAAVSRLDACVARLFTVYGPLEHTGRLLPSLLQAARSGDAVPLSDGTQRRDFCYVEEIVEGLLRLAVSDVAPGDVINLATGAMHTVRDFIETAASVVHLEAAQLQFGALPQRPEEMAHDGVSVAKLNALTGWLPTDDITEGVARTIGRLAELSSRRGVGAPSPLSR